MNVMDWCLVVVAVVGILFGYHRGLVGQLISLASLIIAYIVAYKYYTVVSSWLGDIIRWPELDPQSVYGYALQELEWETYLNHAIAFISIFIIVNLVCSIIGGVINMVMKVPGLNILNKWSGAMLGLLGAMVIIIVAVNVMTAIPSEPVQQQMQESRVTQFIKHHLPAFINPLDIWPEQKEQIPFEEPSKIPMST